VLYYIFYRIGQFIALTLPLNLAYSVAVFFSDLHYLFADKDRFLVGENLKAIFPDKTKKEIRQIRISMSRNFAKYLVDFFRFSKIDEAYIKKTVKIENVNYVNEAVALKKGVILLTAHLGNWELGGVVISTLGYPFWVVALEHKDKEVNDFFNAQRQSKGMKVIPFGKAVRQCLHTLQQGEFLGLVGDRDFNAKGIVVDFFGKPTLFPEGPAAFSLKTGASIVPGFMTRNPDDTFTLKFEKPIVVSDTGNRNENIRNTIVTYKAIIEDYIRKYPDQWYMFRRFWIDENMRNHTHA